MFSSSLENIWIVNLENDKNEPSNMLNCSSGSGINWIYISRRRVIYVMCGHMASLIMEKCGEISLAEAEVDD